MSKRYFEFVDGSSSKFWEIWKDGTEVYTRYGKIGASGQTTVKDEGDAAKAQKLYDKLVKEKTGKGYVEQTTTAPAAAPAAPAVTPGARYFEFVDGSSSKFWEIRIDGTEVYTRYGKIGAAGSTTVKDEGDAGKAQKLHDKLVKEKTGKGYVEKTGGADPDDDDDEEDADEDADEDEDEDEDDEDDRGEIEDSDGDDSHLDGDAGSRRFEHGGTKFWEIRVEGASHTVTFGKVGTNGQEKTKDFASAALAQKDADRLIAEKTQKGYEEV